MTVQELNTIFGKNIRTYRKKMGLTQKQLGMKIGIIQQTVSWYEYGKHFPEALRMIELADALGVEVSQLFERQG